MKKTTAAWFAACLMLILGASSSVGAFELDSAIERFDATPVIDNGVLYAASTEATLRLDLATGKLEIHYASGFEFFSQLESTSASDALLEWPELITLRSASGVERDDPSLMAICATEAAVLNAAIAAAQAACSEGDTPSCQNALNLLDSAQDAFNQCLRAFLEMY